MNNREIWRSALAWLTGLAAMLGIAGLTLWRLLG